MAYLGFVPIRVDPVASTWLPKPGGGARRMASLSDRDARRWHRLGGRIASVIDPRLPPRVMGNRAVVGRSGRPPAWRLRSVGPSLRGARRAAAALAARSPALLRTDVAAFYPSVTPGTLAGALSAAGADPHDARLAADMMDGWGSEGHPGLPIGPPASAVLANAVLWGVDRSLGPFPFLRWVDDLLIALPGDGAAAEVLERFDEALGRVGLRRNEAKTLLSPGAVRWLGGPSAADATEPSP